MAVSSKDIDVLFSLNGAVKYKYIPNYQDMRGGYDKLCGVVRSLGEDPTDGTAYVFTSKDQKVVKIIRHEHNECQMYYQKFDKGMSFVRLEFNGVHPIYVLEWKYLLAMLSCPVIKSIGPIELKCGQDAEYPSLLKDNPIGRDLLMTWMGKAQQIRLRNMKVNEIAAKLYRQLREDGLRCCVLKGQGNALMYPNPYSRTPGDVDVWVNASRVEITEYAMKHFILDKDIRYHHLETSIDGVPVELHFSLA